MLTDPGDQIVNWQIAHKIYEKPGLQILLGYLPPLYDGIAVDILIGGVKVDQNVNVEEQINPDLKVHKFI